MNVDIVLSNDPGFNREEFQKSHGFQSLISQIKKLTDRLPVILKGIECLDSNTYYLLFASLIEKNFHQYQTHSKNMILMTALPSELIALSEGFDFLAIVNIPHFHSDNAVFLGRKEILEVILKSQNAGNFRSNIHFVNNKYVLVSQRNGQGLIESLIDYLDCIELLKS